MLKKLPKQRPPVLRMAACNSLAEVLTAMDEMLREDRACRMDFEYDDKQIVAYRYRAGYYTRFIIDGAAKGSLHDVLKNL